MKYCSFCAEKVEIKVPDMDDRPRFVCMGCGEIHYQNPKIVAGALVTKGQKVLLCRRAIEPRHGYWTLPAGYMENGETTLEAALRETWEEAEAKTSDCSLYQIFNVPEINQVYFFYRARLQGDFGCGIESLESQLFSPDEIPWDELAFKTVHTLLRRWVNQPDDLTVSETTVMHSRGK